jgi:N-acetylneuraminic acid mutarotase
MEIWEFDPTTAIWTQKTSGPAIGRVHPAFSVVGDRVYIGQGQQNGTWSDLADWYEYNATTDTWTAKTTFMSLRHHAAGATVGNTIYVGTGHHLDTMHDDWYAYDATNDTWQVKSNFTGNGRSAANSVASNGKVYFFAGEDEINFARFDDFREYDPISDSWSNLETFPADGRWAPYMFVHNDTIYVGGGEDEQQVNRKDLWRYDFSSVGLEEFDVNTAAVFPNPSSNVVNIPMKGENTIEIYNSLGQLVFKEKIQGQQVNVEKLDPGMYILRAREKNYSSRLSIQR